MARLDMIYEAMYDLTGILPNNGAIIPILAGAPRVASGWTEGRNIFWSGSGWNIWAHLSDIQRFDGKNWMNLTVHELGHIFSPATPPRPSDAPDDWMVLNWGRFDREGWADFLALLAIQKVGGTVLNGFNDYWMPMDGVMHRAMQIGDGHIFSLAPRVNPFYLPLFSNNPPAYTWDNASFDFGWGILQKVFHSYFDGTLPNESKGFVFCNGLSCGCDVKTERTGECGRLLMDEWWDAIILDSFIDFLDRCSFFLGFDIKNLWTEEAKALYESIVSNRPGSNLATDVIVHSTTPDTAQTAQDGAEARCPMRQNSPGYLTKG
jgi:hypothetical protein